MRKCSQCGRVYSDLINTCSYCGTPLNGGTAPASNQQKPVQQSYTPPVQPSAPPVQQRYTPPVQPSTPPVQQRYTPPVQPSTPPVQQRYTPPVAPATENVGMGILGAFLFAIGGAVVQGILINVGKVAAIAGIVTFFLAMYGYKKFSGIGETPSKKAVWLCIPISLFMIVMGTVLGTAVVVSRIVGVTLSESLHLIQQSEELLEAMGSDMASTVILWAVSIVISLLPRKKKK